MSAALRSEALVTLFGDGLIDFLIQRHETTKAIVRLLRKVKAKAAAVLESPQRLFMTRRVSAPGDVHHIEDSFFTTSQCWPPFFTCAQAALA